MIPEWLCRKLHHRKIDYHITHLNNGMLLLELRDSADKKSGKYWAQTFNPSELDVSDKMGAYVIQFMDTSIH